MSSRRTKETQLGPAAHEPGHARYYGHQQVTDSLVS